MGHSAAQEIKSENCVAPLAAYLCLPRCFSCVVSGFAQSRFVKIRPPARNSRSCTFERKEARYSMNEVMATYIDVFVYQIREIARRLQGLSAPSPCPTQISAAAIIIQQTIYSRKQNEFSPFLPRDRRDRVELYVGRTQLNESVSAPQTTQNQH